MWWLHVPHYCYHQLTNSVDYNLLTLDEKKRHDHMLLLPWSVHDVIKRQRYQLTAPVDSHVQHSQMMFCFCIAGVTRFSGLWNRVLFKNFQCFIMSGSSLLNSSTTPHLHFWTNHSQVHMCFLLISFFSSPNTTELPLQCLNLLYALFLSS